MTVRRCNTSIFLHKVGIHKLTHFLVNVFQCYAFKLMEILYKHYPNKQIQKLVINRKQNIQNYPHKMCMHELQGNELLGIYILNKSSSYCHQQKNKLYKPTLIKSAELHTN